jgi:hypothetical protein
VPTNGDLRSRVVEAETRLGLLEARVAKLEALLDVWGEGDAETPKIDPNCLYTLKETACWLKCSYANAHSLAVSGKLATIRIGATGQGAVRVQGSDILAFMMANKTGGPKRLVYFPRLKTLGFSSVR